MTTDSQEPNVRERHVERVRHLLSTFNESDRILISDPTEEFPFDVRLTVADIRALLDLPALEAGEEVEPDERLFGTHIREVVSAFAGPVTSGTFSSAPEKAQSCPRKRSSMTPCVVENGEDARADDGCCVGCGLPAKAGSGDAEKDSAQAQNSNAATVPPSPSAPRVERWAVMRDMREVGHFGGAEDAERWAAFWSASPNVLKYRVIRLVELREGERIVPDINERDPEAHATIADLRAQLAALDKPTRYENIAHAINTAKSATEELARLNVGWVEGVVTTPSTATARGVVYLDWPIGTSVLVRRKEAE